MENDIRQTSTITNTAENFEVDSRQLEGISGHGETVWSNSNFAENWDYYDSIPEINKSIHSYVTFIVGQGFTADSARDKVILDHIKGAGEETFNSIMWNAKVMSKINGCSYVEIIRDPKSKILINLKALSPRNMRTIYNKEGRIIRHEQTSNFPGGKIQTFLPNQMFYIINDKVGDSISGYAVPQHVKETIDSWQEVLRDLRRVSHLSTIRILYVDEQDKTRLDEVKRDYAEAIKSGTVLIIPCKKGEAEFQDLQLPPVEAFLAQIRYYENKYYKAVGFPKSLTGDAEGIPESGGKMARVNFEPTYLREVIDFENDIWNQLGIKGKFGRQPSITQGVSDTSDKNINQTQATQPSDTQI